MNIDWITFSSSISGAIIGGLLTGYFALRSTDKSFENQRDHAEESERKMIPGLLQAIHDEIETLWDRYQETMGSQLETHTDGQAILRYYPLSSDFFTVYNGNSFLIGRIPDNDLRKQIIKTYTLAKGIVDSFRLNNHMVEKFETAAKIHQETSQEIHQQQTTAQLGVLVEYAKTLKEGHKQLKQEVSLLLRSLRKNGVLSED